MRCLMLLVVATAALCLPGCQDETAGPGENCWCSMEFAQVYVTIIDAGGHLVTDARLEVTMTRTGEVLNSSRLLNSPRFGQYAVFNDSFKDLVAPVNRFAGEEIQVRGYRKELVLEETFRVGVTDECLCHVRKISGPDTVRVD